jgi:hypothetical protein
MDIGSFPHQVTRLVFDTGQPYEQFRARYEAAVPALDENRLAGLAARGAAVMLYVPLRTVIYAGPDDRAFFAVDQPSTEVATFGLAPVTQVGTDLDRKLTTLLSALDVPAAELDGPS